MENNDGGNKHQPDSEKSAPPPVVINNKNSTSGAYAPDNNQAKTKQREPRAVLIWTAILAIGTWILGGAAIWSDFLVRDTGRRELRAYLDINSTVPPELVPGQPAKVEFVILNSGHTPAYNVTPFGDGEIRSYPPPRLEVYRIPIPDRLVETTINPERTYHIHASTKVSLSLKIK